MPDPAARAGTLVAPERRLERGVFYLLILLMAAGLVWAQLTTVQVFIRATGIVRPDGEVVRIAIEDGGLIARIHAEEGDIVDVGQILLTLDRTEQRARRGTLLEQIGTREAQLAEIERQAQTLTAVYDAERSRLDAETRAARALLARQQAAYRARVDAARIRLSQASDDHDRASLLFAEGLASRQSFDDSLHQLELAELEQARIRAERPDPGPVAVLERSATLTATRFSADLAELRSTRHPIEADLSELRLRLELGLEEERRRTIRSPARGRLTLVDDIHQGERLSAGTVIATLEPMPEVRVVEAVVANDQATEVHSSQMVRLVASESLTVQGVVKSISPDVRVLEGGLAGYRVIVLPQEPGLRLGQGVEVRFLTESRSILALLLRRISAGFSELGG